LYYYFLKNSQDYSSPFDKLESVLLYWSDK